MKNKGRLFVRPPMLKAKSSEIRPASKVPHFGGFRGLGGQVVKKDLIFSAGGGEKNKVTINIVYFTYSSRRPG